MIVIPAQKEGIKLTKTSKSYTWEIKLVEDVSVGTATIDRLEEINKDMIKRFLSREEQ